MQAQRKLSSKQKHNSKKFNEHMSIKTDEDDRKNKLTSGKCAKWDEWDEDSEVPT